MISEIKKFHFANPTQNKILGLLNRIADLGVILCFDLEDFVKDVLDKKTEKTIHRNNVISSLESIINSSYEQKIGIRINSIDTEEFYKDIDLLESIKNKVTFECIFLPKIENGDEIRECNEILKERNIDFVEIIPIIENKDAFRKLNEIISSSKNIVKKLSFGHCDYNFDIGNFPFYHQDSEQYWKWIHYIVENINSKDIMFINSPYLYLDDNVGFLNMITRLFNVTKRTYGQITLSLDQVNICSFYENNSQVKNGETKKSDLKCSKETIAKKIIKDYENNLKANRSFSINADRILIAPQEYIAAKKYLSKPDVDNEF